MRNCTTKSEVRKGVIQGEKRGNTKKGGGREGEIAFRHMLHHSLPTYVGPGAGYYQNGESVP